MVRVNDRGLVEISYPVTLKDGKILGFPSELFKAHSRGLEGDFTWTLTRRKKRRSVKQNSVQWWYFTEISRISGYTPEKVKQLAQEMFLKRDRVNEVTGEIYSVILETSSLSVDEHIDFTHNVREWAREFWDIHLPEPRENGE